MIDLLPPSVGVANVSRTEVARYRSGDRALRAAVRIDIFFMRTADAMQGAGVTRKRIFAREKA